MEILTVIYYVPILKSSHILTQNLKLYQSTTYKIQPSTNISGKYILILLIHLNTRHMTGKPSVEYSLINRKINQQIGRAKKFE